MKEAKREEKLMVKQLERSQREAEKEKKRIDREQQKEKLQNVSMCINFFKNFNS